MRAHEKEEKSGAAASVKRAPWLAFWTAEVDEYNRALFQVNASMLGLAGGAGWVAHVTRVVQPMNDDDQVFLLQLEKNPSLKNLYARAPVVVAYSHALVAATEKTFQKRKTTSALRLARNAASAASAAAATHLLQQHRLRLHLLPRIRDN